MAVYLVDLFENTVAFQVEREYKQAQKLISHFHNQLKCLYIIDKVKPSALLMCLLVFFKYTDSEEAVGKSNGILVKRG